MLRAACAGLMMAGSAGQAAAEELRPWSMSATVSGAQADSDSAPLMTSGELAIERIVGDMRFGAALGASQGEARVPEIDAVIDDTSAEGAFWWGVGFGGYDVTFTVGHGRQSLDGAFTAPGGAVIAVDGDTSTTSVAASLARTFGETGALTPSISLSYNQTETDLDLTAAGGGVLAVSESAEGVTATLAVDGAAPLSQQVAFIGGAAFVATDEAAAQGLAVRGGRAQPTQREAGAAQWGEAYVGLEFAPSPAASVSAAIGSTLGRENEEMFASVSLGWRF